MCLVALVIIIADILLVSSGVIKNDIYKDGDYICVTGKIKSVNATEYGTDYFLDNGFYVTSSKLYRDVSNGDTVMVKGNIKDFKLPRNDGQFDQKAYYQSIGYFYKISAKDISLISPKKTHMKIVNKVRDKIAESFEETASQGDSGVLKAIVLGDKQDMDSEYYALYQRNGIAHILAISGLHVSFVGLALYRLLRKSGVSCVMAFGVLSAFLCFYALLTGNGVSARRAVIMCVVNTGAEIVGRMYDALSALSLAAVILITENPFVIYNSGFLLSFSAILGICILVTKVTEILKPPVDKWSGNVYFDTPVVIKYGKKMAGNVIMSFAQSFSISVFMLPVVLYSFYETPVLGVFLNVLVIPLMSIVLFSGIAGGIIAVFSAAAGSFFIGSTHYILLFYQMLCNITDKIPFNVWTVGKPDIWQIALYYVCLILGMHVVCRIKNKKAGMFILLSLVMCVISYRRSCDVQIDMIDVGQGDCIYVSSSGINMLFDGGSTDISQVGKYRIQPFLKSRGVKQLDYVFVSHTDKDHISGIIELIEDKSSVAIKTIVMQDYEPAKTEENYIRICELAKERGIRIAYASNEKFNITRDELNIKCVSPCKNAEYGDINAASAVYVLQYKEFKMLMTGDMTMESEEHIDPESIGKITCLKVAHHGSKTSGGKEFISELSPDAAIISCGIKNRFGHPSPQTLDNLSNSGCIIYETDICGQISICYNKNKYSIKTKFDGYVKIQLL